MQLTLLLTQLNSNAIVRGMSNLHEFKAKRGLTQEQLASLFDVSQGMVWQWLNNKRPISPEQAVSLEQISGNELRRWDLRPNDWWRIWPELIGAPDAPSVPNEKVV